MCSHRQTRTVLRAAVLQHVAPVHPYSGYMSILTPLTSFLDCLTLPNTATKRVENDTATAGDVITIKNKQRIKDPERRYGTMMNLPAAQ
ncbi:hypothetical protein C8Q74DRAFT_477942 [Fomes fomentarius]|nr:hypothetical protein C8Q74DRAFT_477942 [Fomes fomentarius]